MILQTINIHYSCVTPIQAISRVYVVCHMSLLFVILHDERAWQDHRKWITELSALKHLASHMYLLYFGKCAVPRTIAC